MIETTEPCNCFKMDMIGNNPNICLNCKFEKKLHK